MDVVDVQMNPNETYHYIMSYQDQRTKYVCLRALQTADAKEVCDSYVCPPMSTCSFISDVKVLMIYYFHGFVEILNNSRGIL